MTTTYSPDHPHYLDESDLRVELERVFDLCHACRLAAPMAKEICAAGNDVVCGHCHLANGAIEQETGSRPVHPVQLLACAYGVQEEHQ